MPEFFKEWLESLMPSQAQQLREYLLESDVDVMMDELTDALDECAGVIN